MKTGLYLMAILFSDSLNERIKRVKEEFAADYGASRALKNPAHITLCPPFKADGTVINALKKSLPKFAVEQNGFLLKLNGYGAFEPRVIFVHPKEEQLLRKLYHNLKNYLIQYFPFEKYHFGTGFKPHVTVAYRDLDLLNFNKAWTIFNKRSFEGEQLVNAFHLLKHDGETWKPVWEFPLATPIKEEQMVLF